MAKVNKVKPQKITPINRGSPVARIVNATMNVNSTSPARAAGTDEDVPGSRLLGPHARDRPIQAGDLSQFEMTRNALLLPVGVFFINRITIAKKNYNFMFNSDF